MRRKKLCEVAASPTSLLLSGRVPMAVLIQVLAVARYFSFYRAAQALGTSQSSVSTRIKAFETDLGIALFDRNTRGVRLTEAGRRFVNEINDAMGILDRAINTAGMRANGQNGAVRIGIHAITTGCFLDRMLGVFYTKYPQVRLTITEGTAQDACSMLRESVLDVAFMASTYEIPDLNSRIIWRDRLMVALPARHLLATRHDVEWRQLAKETFIVRQGGAGPQVHDLIVARSVGKWPTPEIIRVNVERYTLMRMIAVGHGISLFFQSGATPCATNVVFLPIRDELEAIPFSAVWSPRNRDPALSNLLMIAQKMSSNIPQPIS
ncbi:LysR family transcriptional regulator [Brucella sp. 21LCYQ03]|nr:LysR family transcriptional regulator [Brucella sp. 21LCYQ03]